MILGSEQNGGLQTIVRDRVHGAGCPETVLVSGAGIIDFSAFAAGDGFPAARTFQKTAERMNFLHLGRYPGIADQENLHLFKEFMYDDCLVYIGARIHSSSSTASILIFQL